MKTNKNDTFSQTSVKISNEVKKTAKFSQWREISREFFPSNFLYFNPYDSFHCRRQFHRLSHEKKLVKKQLYKNLPTTPFVSTRPFQYILMLLWQRFDAVPVVFALATPSNSHHDYTRVKFVVWIVSCFNLWSWNINRRNWVARCGVFVLKSVLMFTNNYLYVFLNVFF